MKHILIATHGDYAKGAVSAAEIIAGKKEFVTCINAYSEAKNINEAVEAYFASIPHEDEVIILTDLFGGSVNQAIMPYTKQGNVYLITGFNLALLLEVMMMDPEACVDEDQLRGLVNGAKAQVMYVNDVLQSSNDDDFD